MQKTDKYRVRHTKVFFHHAYPKHRDNAVKQKSMFCLHIDFR